MPSTPAPSKTCSAFALLLGACCHAVAPPTTTAGEAAPAVAAVEPEKAGSTATGQGLPSRVGLWWSEACGARSYPRELELSSDGTFVARDLVSPCPPAANCVWSGIVTWSGTWAGDEDGISLVVTQADHGPDTAPRPDRLGDDDGQFIEGSDPPCTWRRVTSTEPHPAGH